MRGSKTSVNRGVALLAVAFAATVCLATQAASTPHPTSAVIRTRIFNDCPVSILATTDNYPALIQISDQNPGSCYGYANLHNWRFSEDDVNPAVFDNDADFQFGADLMISGTGEGEAGLQVSPWWAKDTDGRLNVRTTDGEIAGFGGRLPFYSFTANHGLHYVKGTSIHLEITYRPNGLTASDPATIVYRVLYNSSEYSSGALPFDEGNPAEDPPYGLWGMLNDGRVGGHLQYFLSATPPPHGITATWSNVYFVPAAAVALRGGVLANGGDPSSSAGYSLLGTLGQPAVGHGLSSDFLLCSGFWCFGGSRVVAVDPPPIGPPPEALPTELSFGAPVPNPTRGPTRFALALPQPATVTFVVYDVAGRQVGEPVSRAFEAGYHQLFWEGAAGRAGVYFARLLVDGRVRGEGRIVLVR